MKTILILSALIISTLGAQLNQYLPPRPNNDNIQFQPPLLTNSGFANQPSSSATQNQQQFTHPIVQNSRQDLTPNSPEQNSQASSPFKQTAKPFGQFSNTFGQQDLFKNNNNGNPTKQYLTPNKQDTSGQSSNAFGNFQNPNSGFNQGQFSGFGTNTPSQGSFDSKSQNQIPFNQGSNTFQQINQNQGFNGQSNPNRQYGQGGQFNGQFSGSQGQFGPQSAPIGLIRSEFNPDAGDGHYSYLYETENGILAQEEGFVQKDTKSAQGGFSYTSPEGEHVSLEYTADENGFIPKGSHVPQIPDAILKSIELNKAEEALGKFNEGSYREEYNQESNGNEAKGQSPFNFQGNRQDGPFNSFQNSKPFNEQNKYQYSGPIKTNNFPDQGTFASQDNKQINAYRPQQSSGHEFGQQNNGNNGYQYSAPGKNNFADQGTFASQDNKQITPFGGQQTSKPIFGQNNGQNNGPAHQGTFASQDNKQINAYRPQHISKSRFGQQSTGNQFGQQNTGNNGYQYSAPAKNNFADQGTFASQDNKQITPFGSQQTSKPTFGQINGPAQQGQFGFQQSNSFNNQQKPQHSFGQQSNGQKSPEIKNNGYQYPIPEQSSFASQQNIKIKSFGDSQGSKPSFQFSLVPQYGAPEQSSSASQNNNQFNGAFQGPKNQVPSSPGNNGFNSHPSFPSKEQANTASEQFGTVQDSQGGYKY